MAKMKTRKTLQKRVKITATNKLTRRHQFSAGHLKRKKSKEALEGHKKSMKVFKGDVKKYKKMLGV